MFKLTTLFFLCLLNVFCSCGQDSVSVKLRPKYNNVGGLHRLLFGENYRKEWSTNTTLPVIRISQVAGGLKPLRLGGGHQTVSLRLSAPSGEEWVLRHIEKDPSILIPPELRKTFARDLLDDAMSAQHPFSPLVVSKLAEETGVPHATPIIGVVDDDSALGDFRKQFAGKVCLLEEREPMGNSDNTAEMFQNLNEDNDNSVDSRSFLKALLLDLFIGDWDRHADQWRWIDTKKGKAKYYVGVPRDRDQAFYVNQGLFPEIASWPWFVPSLQGFKGNIKQPKFSFKESSFLTSRPFFHLPYEEWMRITNEFTKALTDAVIADALINLPSGAYDLRHPKLFSALKTRRDNIPAAIKEYFHFVNRYADIRLSNKHEQISIRDTLDKALLVQILKLGKSDERPVIMSNIFYPGITKEIRIYTGSGNDNVIINNKSSPIRLRVVGEEGAKNFNIVSSSKNIRIYHKKDNVKYEGQTDKLSKRISDDSSNTAFVGTNRYNILKPLIAVGLNRDDGFILGLGLQYTHQGFRKTPYASMNRLMTFYSFATSAFKIKYNGEWLHVFGKTDLIANADIRAPENTQNFFGRGNEAVFIKSGDYRTYYRTRFNTYQLGFALRWRNKKGASFSIGPALQRYSFDSSENKGRFINNGSFINSYDSSTINRSKMHGGAVLNILVDKRDKIVIPAQGYYFNVQLQGYGGLNNDSKSFGQIIPEFSVYKKLNAKGTIILADRIGAGLTVGKPAFYQSHFIGGHENLLGFLQYRFAGDHMLYNNLELRIKLANFTGYIIPGQFGLIGFYDAGRVWVKDQKSDVWHHGVGGGLYFAPAQIVVISAVAGYSKEGLYPYVTLGFRY